MPMPSTSPDIEITFNVIPVKYMITTAVITESGIEHAITIVGFISLRKSISTITASIAPTIIFCTTLSTTKSMYTP